MFFFQVVKTGCKCWLHLNTQLCVRIILFTQLLQMESFKVSNCWFERIRLVVQLS